MATKIKLKHDPDTVVIARQSFSSPHGDFKRGQRVRASHEVVAVYPELFAPDGITDDELGTFWDDIVARNEEQEREQREAAQAAFTNAAAGNRVRLEVDVVKCVRDFDAHFNGEPARIVKGSTVTADSELAISYPENWRAA